MTKYIIAIPIVFLIGCSKNETHNVVEYQGVKCKSLGDVGVVWDGRNYICKYSNVESNHIPIKRVASSGCETEITEIFTSKSSGKITVCKGKILTGNQKTKIVRINK